MKLLDKAQRNLSKHPIFVKMAIKLRNQANMIIGYYLGESNNTEINGEKLIVELLAPHCRTFVDVGANIGNWTQLFIDNCKHMKEGLLFEPGLHACRRLKERFSTLNTLEIYQSAVGSSSGSLLFYEEKNAGEHSSFVLESTADSPIEILVPIITLDSLIEKKGWDSLDYLKIDTEGFDYHVLAGAKNLLLNHKIRALQFEYNSSWAGSNSTLSGALNLLSECKYSCYLIRADGLYKLNYKTFGEYFSFSNFLAISEGWHHLIKELIKGTI
jgi:FkbM family methyltransferase